MPSRCCSKSQRSFYVPPNRNANSEFEVNSRFSSLNKPYMKGVVLAERQMSSTDLGHKRQESSTHPIPSHLCCFSYSITFFLFAKWLTFFGFFLDFCVRNGNHMWLIGRGAWIQRGWAACLCIWRRLSRDFTRWSHTLMPHDISYMHLMWTQISVSFRNISYGKCGDYLVL